MADLLSTPEPPSGPDTSGDITLGILTEEFAQSLCGRHYYEPPEGMGVASNSYAGITRSNPFVERKMSITLEDLSNMMDKLPKFPKTPPYYRAHPETYRSLLWQCRVGVEHVESLKFSHVTIVEDPTVPVGAFLPPEGWGKDE